jgi:peptide deformylase
MGMLYELVPVIDMPKVADSTPKNLIDLYEICQQMVVICEREKGIGLAAFQIGLPWKVFIVKKPSGYEYYVDSEYEPIGTEKQTSIEGCLSLRNSSGKLRRFEVERYKSIHVIGKQLVVNDVGSLELIEVDFVSSGDMMTVVFQHEVDHHHGILAENVGHEVDIW